jgi:glyoxylase-like metal-dependent hydrolase (beta-lactamase superfamily II)
LRKENLATGDIDSVFLSHCHPDHILLAGIFEKAKFITFDTNLSYHNDSMMPFEPHTLGKDSEEAGTIPLLLGNMLRNRRSLYDQERMRFQTDWDSARLNGATDDLAQCLYKHRLQILLPNIGRNAYTVA